MIAVALGYGLMWAAIFVYLLILASRIRDAARDARGLEGRVKEQSDGTGAAATRRSSPDTPTRGS